MEPDLVPANIVFYLYPINYFSIGYKYFFPIHLRKTSYLYEYYHIYIKKLKTYYLNPKQ